jgi:transposase-like protein
MVQVKDLTELTVRDLWQEVKHEDDWWSEFNERTLSLVKLLLEASLEEEILQELHAAKYKRVSVRCGYRNGCYERSLYTRFGVIKSLKVPRTRNGHESQILPRYRRREDSVNRTVREMFLAGVSTRRVGEVLNTIHSEGVSPQTVSRVAETLDIEVCRYHTRRLSDHYQYLFLDGITLKVKGVLGAKKRLVLCAYGIATDGKRELLSFRQASAESEAQWEAFLRDIYQRGLLGNALRLVVTDGCAGLHLALDTVYPYVPRQRCWAHKLRNIAAKVRRGHQEECLRQLKSVYQAETRKAGVMLFRSWAGRWRLPEPKAVRSMEEDLEELLNFLDCPPEHRRRVRTTNVIERAFREVRRRTRPMSCFQNSASVERIIYGLVCYLNRKWMDKPLMQFTQNT